MIFFAGEASTLMIPDNARNQIEVVNAVINVTDKTKSNYPKLGNNNKNNINNQSNQNKHKFNKLMHEKTIMNDLEKLFKSL